MLINPNDKSIETDQQKDNLHIRSRKEYELFAPYGYVPKYEVRAEQRTDLSHPILRTETQFYHNHVIEDLDGRIQKYTDLAHIEIYPNPIEEEYEVLLKGIPETQVSQIQIRDLMGNLLFTHLNPPVLNDIISLNGSTYNTGPLIILVYTQHGIYSETLSKI